MPAGHEPRRSSCPPSQRLTVGTVGAPGKRTFYLQARQDDQLVTLKLEKQQVGGAGRAPRPSCSRTCPPPDRSPATTPSSWRSPSWPSGRSALLRLDYDSDSDQVVLVAEEVAELDEDGRAGAHRGASARLAATREQVGRPGPTGRRHWSRPAGRRCPLCGYPLDPGGHSCPRTNGHRPPDTLSGPRRRARSRSRAACPGAPTARSSSPSASTASICPPSTSRARASGPSGTSPTGLYQREVAAYELSEALGWDLVPETVLARRGAPRRRVAAALRRRRLRAALLHPARGRRPTTPPCGPWPPSTSLANNADRKGGHCLIDADRPRVGHRPRRCASTPSPSCAPSSGTSRASRSPRRILDDVDPAGGMPAGRAAVHSCPTPRRRGGPEGLRPGAARACSPTPRRAPLSLAAGLSAPGRPGRLPGRSRPEDHRAGPLSSGPAASRSAWAAPCGRRRRCRGRRSRRWAPPGPC